MNRTNEQTGFESTTSQGKEGNRNISMISILSDNRFISKEVKRIRRLVTEKNRENRRNSYYKRNEITKKKQKR